MSDLYTVSNPENLNAETIDEAINEYVSGFYDGESAPDIITIDGYSREKLTADNYGFMDAFDRLFENLDEELDPECSCDNRLNAAITEAYRKFVDVVVSEYSVWSCYQDESHQIDLKDWRNGNDS